MQETVALDTLSTAWKRCNPSEIGRSLAQVLLAESSAFKGVERILEKASEAEVCTAGVPLLLRVVLH